MKKGFIIGAIILILGVIAMAISIGIGGKKVYDVAPDAERHEYTFTDDYAEIHFNTRNKGVEIKQSEDDDIHLVVYENEDRYYKFKEDENLTIDYVDSGSHFNNIISIVKFSNETTELYIPKNLEQKLFIDAENGVVEINDVELNNIDLYNKNAIVRLDDITTLNDITINNTNGLVEIYNVKTRDFVVDNENAVINIDTVDANNVKIDNMNAYVTLSSVYSNNNIDIRNSNASVDLNNVDFEKELIVSTNNAHVNARLEGIESDYTFDVKTTDAKATVNGKEVNGVTGNGSKIVQIRNQNGSVDIETK